MKPEEQIAAEYLKSLGLGAPTYEPDGNVPPDFLLPQSIAVEVRRLNKHVEVNGVNEGLEQADIRLTKLVEGTVRKLDGLWSGRTYYVFIRFNRPLPDKKTLVPRLETTLRRFLQNPSTGVTKLSIDKALAIDLIPATPVTNRCFIIGGNSDPARAGWLVEDLVANIQLCSDEKKSKVAPYRARYNVWWLLLVDFIGYGIDAFDRANLKTQTQITHGWDKLIVVSPVDPSNAYEI